MSNDWLRAYRRLVAAALIGMLCAASALTLFIGPFPGRPVIAQQEGEQEVITSNGCGVERWVIKTGMDSGASQVNQRAVVPTTIFHLRSLPAPGTLPLRSRIRPVETTVFSVSATLLRYKIEADSDVHLVLSDSGGRTMIAEIPAAYCILLPSPFLPSERYVRSKFSSRFHPSGQWQRVNTAVQVTGVGFFDFKHGQSGVAPNGIELHPVLAISFSGSSGSPPPRPSTKATATPKPASSSGSFSLTAYVSPNPVSYGAYPTLYAKTSPGATCTASVVYSTGRPPRSFDGSEKTAGSSGIVGWTWHMESKGTSGSATVTCSSRGQTKSTSTSFTIA